MDGKDTMLSTSDLPCGFCRVQADESLTILDANEAYYELYGYSKTEAIQAGFHSVAFISYPPDFRAAKKVVSDLLEAGKDTIELETRVVHRSGRVGFVLISGRFESGMKTLRCIVLDVTERRQAFEKLRRGEEERTLLLKHTRRFIFRFHIASRTASLYPDAAEELGLPEQVPGLPESMVESGNVAEESSRDYIRFFYSMLRGEPSGDTVVLFRNKSGAYAWYHCIFSMVYGADGEAGSAVVSFEDVSEKREKEIAYEKWNQHSQMQISSSLAYYECNLTNACIDRIDGALADIIPRDILHSYEETLQFVENTFVCQEDREEHHRFFSRGEMLSRFERGERELTMEYRRADEEGQLLWTCVSVQLLSDPYTNDRKAFYLARNIDDEKREQMELQARSQQDALTGLLNRRALVDEVNHILRSGEPTSRHAFIIFDIDHFKDVNDRMGHQFGDQVLVKFALALKSSLRSGDLLGRLSGDEFVICLKNMPLDEALERKISFLRERIAKSCDGQATVSSSLGVATYPRDGLSFEELYQKADIALYEAKRLGRNRAVFYQPGMDREGSVQPERGREGASDLRPVPEEKNGQPSLLGEGTLEKLFVAVQRSCDEIYLVDPMEDRISPIHGSAEKGIYIAGDRTLRRFIRRLSDDMVYPADVPRFLELMPSPGEAWTKGFLKLYSELRIHRLDGDYGWCSIQLIPLDPQNGDTQFLCMISDLNSFKSVQKVEEENRILLSKQIEDESYRTILEASGAMLIEYNEELNSYYISPSAQNFTFHKRAGRKENNYFISEEDVHPEDFNNCLEISRSIRMGKMSAETVARLQMTGGGYRYCQLVLTVLRNDLGIVKRSQIIVRDVDEATRDRKELEYQAEYDELTGHANLNRFKKDAVRLLKNRGSRKYAVWYCDLRNFKLVNDMFGYDFGDRVLRYLADVGTRVMREGEVFARVSADHFTALMRYDDKKQLEDRFWETSEQLAEYGELAGKKLRLELVSGIYCIEVDEDLLSIQDMIDRANLAQTSVKKLGGSRFAFYIPEMRGELLRQKEIEAVMATAMKEGEFCAYFQPLADAQNEGRIIGAEVLARWNRPGWGVVQPGEFIPLFEKNGFIVELDRFIFEKACQMLRGLMDEGAALCKLAVNVSRVSVFQKDFVEQYLARKEAYGIPDGCLELECTETTVVENVEALESVMRMMRENGFSFSMDDFGSGYSSLNLLKDVTVDVLKLDRMFFEGGKLTEHRNQTIVSSIIAMARALGTKVVAEGIEEEGQLAILQGLGCDYIQGYVISRPVQACTFRQILREQSHTAKGG